MTAGIVCHPSNAFLSKPRSTRDSIMFASMWSQLAAIAISLFAPPTSLIQNRNASLSHIEPYVQDLVDRYHVPGLSIAVVRQDTEDNEAFEHYQAHFGTATTDGKAVDRDVSQVRAQCG